MISRFAENISFGITSSFQLLSHLIREYRPDIVFINTWALFAQLLNSTILRIWNVPIISYVPDIYPESLIDKGMIRQNGVMAKIMRQLDRFYLRYCKYVITLSPGMVDILLHTRQLQRDRVKYIPMYIDAGLFSESVTGSGFRKRHNVGDDAFVAMFAGSLTLSAGVEMYIGVADILRDQGDIQILLVGDGSMRADVEREISARKLSNIRVIHPLKPTEVPEVQAAADVLLLPLKGNMSHSAAPSKQVAYMLSGKPIVASLPENSYPARIITDAKAGFILPSDNPAAVASLLLDLGTRHKEIYQMGENAKRYALQHFTRGTVLPELILLIETSYKR